MWPLTTPLLRRALAPFGLALLLAGCGAGPLFARRVSCLSGAVPHVGRPVPDEMFALMRRERERAAQASPLVRARLLESIPDLFPDVSDLWPEPPCHDELEREGIDALEASPLRFDRELVARVRAVHDAPPLVGLALRDEATVSDYHLGPDEPGPPPAKSFLRYRALANIPAYWIADNRAEGRRLLLDRLRTSPDATELLLIHGAAEAIFDQALWGHPERAEGSDGPTLLGGWIADLGKRLQGPSDRVTLELVLRRLGDTGRFGVRFGHEAAARRVLKTVLDVGGDLPLTRGIAGGARDLAEMARGALFDLDTQQKSIGFDALPPPRRKSYDPRLDWLDREPAGGRPAEADRVARVRDLDAELVGLKHNAPRCHVLGELGEWLSDGEMAERFEGLIAPAFQGDRVVLNTESLCRLRLALELKGVDEGRRSALAARMLKAPLPGRGARDLSLDEHSPGIGYPADEDPVRQIAATALARHLEWVDASPDLRTWLEQRATEPIPMDHAPAETWTLLAPAFERAIDFHLAGSAEARPDTARELLLAWIGSIRTALAAKPVGNIYPGEVVVRRIRALGERGRKAAIAAEVIALLDELGGRRDAAVARYLLELPPL